ncbi:hypothetical protein CSOJ01_13484 [Colletotrichum sojae]|uniref:Uncharacterized protein n=1 Tax=Colletotrichum sojae TaxID=2175907 RepID=A0A8H6IT08_9PEZI|nr:hypothetical protein CSOJ01_13484 [Colletotrichum sojae]
MAFVDNMSLVIRVQGYNAEPYSLQTSNRNPDCETDFKRKSLVIVLTGTGPRAAGRGALACRRVPEVSVEEEGSVPSSSR